MEYITQEDFVENLASGQYEIWKLAPECWMLCEFIETNRGKTMNILTIVGIRKNWQIGVDSIERVARDNDAKLIYSVGYPGWKRLLERNGYKTRRMMRMTKELK
jgi:hypothetical protein